MKKFDSLSEQEILALAISLEEEDERVYADFALGAIIWVRHRYMDAPAASAAIQVAFGGALVFITGVLIGRS